MDGEGSAVKVVPDGADSASAAPRDLEYAVEYTRAAHLNFQEMVKLADQKAGTIMAGTGLVVALLGSNLVDRFRVNPRGALACAGAVTLVLLLGAALHAMLVLLPRFPSGGEVASVVGAPGLMWGISRFNEHPADYVRSLMALTPADAIADLAHENLKIAWILEHKWKWMAGATRLSCSAFVAWAVTVVLAAFGD
jgi:hypothetical protein